MLIFALNRKRKAHTFDVRHAEKLVVVRVKRQCSRVFRQQLVHSLSKILQQGIGLFVAQSLVDVIKVFQVQQENTGFQHRILAKCRSCYPLENSPVWQAGQLMMSGCMMERAFGFLLLLHGFERVLFLLKVGFALAVEPISQCKREQQCLGGGPDGYAMFCQH